MNKICPRTETKRIYVGGVPIGGGAPVVVQSMTNTKTSDVRATAAQIMALEDAGCEIVRVGVPDVESARAIEKLKEAAAVPIVADIHFQADLAVAAIEAGADKIRINPGNIGSTDRVRKVVEAAAKASIPIRIGVNIGSLSKSVRAMDISNAAKLVASAEESIKLLESFGFEEIIVSVKSSDVLEAVEAYRALAARTLYPLHLGITESGTYRTGTIRSAVGLGIMLADGIGDTIRVSLAADPVHEVHVAREILQATGVRRFFPELIACPTCARCEVDLIPIAEQVERRLRLLDKPIKIAVMGCVVNGPGEAKAADFGLAAGKGRGVIFKRGDAVKTIDESEFVEELLKMIEES